MAPRRNNLGVATFLILEKQKHLAAAASQKMQTPEGVGNGTPHGRGVPALSPGLPLHRRSPLRLITRTQVGQHI